MKTSYKIFISKVISNLIRLIEKKEVIKKRNDINWNLDLTEGIDLYLYIFGKFEYEIAKAAQNLNLNYYKKIFDIGANFGVQSLQFANIFKESKIYSAEPTNYAFLKFKKNLLLNSQLSNRIFLDQYFISNKEIDLPTKIYSSWKTSDQKINLTDRHNLHKGILKKTDGATKLTLDEYVELKKIQNVDFIKLDVDGYELNVLKSGQNFLKKRPPIFMELAPYLYNEHGYSIEDLIDFLKSYDYDFYNINNYQKVILNKKFFNKISDGSSINILVKS